VVARQGFSVGMPSPAASKATAPETFGAFGGTLARPLCDKWIVWWARGSVGVPCGRWDQVARQATSHDRHGPPERIGPGRTGQLAAGSRLPRHRNRSHGEDTRDGAVRPRSGSLLASRKLRLMVKAVREPKSNVCA